MALTNAGRNLISGMIVGEATTDFTNANARIGVGNGTGAFAGTQTDLLGASSLRKGMEATYPTRATNVLTFRATWGTGEGNFAWDEWGVFNGTGTGDTMLNRKVEALGTKTTAQTWQLTVQLTVNNP